LVVDVSTGIRLGDNGITGDGEGDDTLDSFLVPIAMVAVAVVGIDVTVEDGLPLHNDPDEVVIVVGVVDGMPRAKGIGVVEVDDGVDDGIIILSAAIEARNFANLASYATVSALNDAIDVELSSIDDEPTTLVLPPEPLP
jgi:hypothetical protein